VCGFVGFIAAKYCVHSNVQVLRAMAHELTHRGPDDEGFWLEDDVGLAHRRLSVLDLTAAGHQPMTSESGRYVIAYNGEIYNFLKIREYLQARGHQFRGRSDTEVLLSAIEAFGVEETLRKIAGMFAFALWDKNKKTLYLARDRSGEKPLYYGQLGNQLVFASELKALYKHPAWYTDIDRQALLKYIRLTYIPAPLTIHTHIKKLCPGHYLVIQNINDGQFEVVNNTYWQAKDAVEKGRQNIINNDEEAVEQLDKVMKNVIQEEMISDVPVGAWLSGGVDSSTIVAIMQNFSTRPVKTFSIGYQEDEYNEAVYAKAVARHLRTDHTELYLTPQGCLNVIPDIVSIYDEPFADSSQIPTYLVAKLARESVTVSLSGDGADELFGGYNRYTWLENIWKKVGHWPLATRVLLSNMLVSIPPHQWDTAFKIVSRLGISHLQAHLPGDKIYKIANLLKCSDKREVYQALISLWQQPEALVLGASEISLLIDDEAQWQIAGSFKESMMLVDQTSYLPDDILAKVDRASMAVSLESRTPFLHPQLIEFAWRIPVDMKVRGGERKWILKQVMNRYLPSELMDRPKMGFGVPIDSWLRGPLREWAESLLDWDILKKQGLFDADMIHVLWKEHLSGKRNLQSVLWAVIMFQAWYDRYVTQADRA